MRIRNILLLFILGLLVFGLYYNTLDNYPTNWDDPALFANNTIQNFNFNNLKQVFTFHDASTYQPVRDLSYMIDFWFWGLKQILVGLHLHNILLYYAMIIFCWLFLFELFTALSIPDKKAFLLSAVTAFIYAVHPVHVESVAWLYARKEPLLGLFTFLSLWTFLKARTNQGARYYFLCAIFLVLAVLSKPTALVIPAVMIALDLLLYLHRKDSGFWIKRAFRYIPIIAFASWQIIRLGMMMADAGGIKPYHGGSFESNLLAVSQILATYFKLSALSFHFCADYPITLFTSLSNWHSWLYLSLNLIAVSSAIIALFYKRYLYSFFVFWYYIFILPVSHILPIAQIMVDRYALLSSLSSCLLLGYIITLPFLSSHRFLANKIMKGISVAALLAVISGYSYMTVKQNDTWQNSYTLWANTLKYYPNSSPANVNLSTVFIKQGKYEQAMELCVNAIKTLPYDYLAISNLGLAQMLSGQYENAIHNFKQALTLRPTLEKPKLGLANCYWETRDYKNAYALYCTVLTPAMESPQFRPVALYRAGFSAFKLGKKDEALKLMYICYNLPDRPPFVFEYLAQGYTSMGMKEDAIRCYKDLLPYVSKNEAAKETLREKLKKLGADLNS